MPHEHRPDVPEPEPPRKPVEEPGKDSPTSCAGPKPERKPLDLRVRAVRSEHDASGGH